MKRAKDESTLTNDPLLYDLELPLHAVHYPLGFSVEIATNSDQVLAAAEESWGDFRKVSGEPPVQLRVAVLEGGPGKCPPPPTVRGQRNLLVRVADAANFSVSNMELGFALCWLTPAVAANRGYLRYYFLEGMSWDLLGPLYLTPIHAACVRLGNKGVLLCGDSGTGKSSLAYACARRGWMFLADDSICLVRKCIRPVVVGNPGQFRFRDSAVKLFPELRDRRITRRLNGKLSIELPTASIPGIKTISECSVDCIVFLKRGEPGPARLLPFPEETALQWFEQVVCFGEEAVREAQKASLRNLISAEVFELRYEDLDSAVARLDALVRHEAGSPAQSHITPQERMHA
jgi:hypothetical protein